MESYYENWKDEEKGRPGAKKGFTATASKRQKDFEKYVGIVGESRETENAAVWSDRLMEAAQKEVMKSTNGQKDLDEEDGNVSVEVNILVEKDRVYLNYASRGLGDSSGDEDDDDDDLTNARNTMAAV